MSSLRERLSAMWTRHQSTAGLLLLLVWSALILYAVAQALIGQSQGLPPEVR